MSSADKHTHTHTVTTKPDTHTDTRTDTVAHHTHTLPQLVTYGTHRHYFYIKLAAMTLYTAILASYLTAQQYRMYKLGSFVCITPLVKYMSLYADARVNTRQMRQFIYTTVTDSLAAVWLLYIVPMMFRGAWYGVAAISIGLLYIAIEYGKGRGESAGRCMQA